ncbi:MAG: rod shape-determining protein MreC [bacterium]|nr:rod shape-determining protein MreC [bacterium]
MTGKIDKTIWIFLLLLFLSAGLYFLDKKSVLYGPKSFLYQYLTAPVQAKSYELWQNINSRFDTVRQIRNCAGELEKTKENLAVSESEKSRVFSLEEENKILRTQLGVGSAVKQKLLPARVIGFSQGLRLDKGEKDGVREGAAIIWQNNLLGKTTTVLPRQSLAETIFDARLKVMTITDKGSKGLSSGEGNSVYLTMVLSGAALSVGDKVFSSGEDGIFPSGLLIGEVEKVEKIPTEMFQKAKLKINIDFGNLRMVFVSVE